MLSIVIPCRDVADVVEDQLRALAAQDVDGPIEVLLADNGSCDGLADRLEAWGERHHLDLRHVDASGTPGVSHARNAGLRAARADLVAVCDADDVVGRGWARGLVAALAIHDLVGGSLELDVLNDEVRRAWRAGPPADRLPVKLGFLPYAVGANVAVRRSVAVAVEGWDESYVAGGDDVDFAWRVQLAGHSIGFAPGAIVHYRFRTDLRGTARQLHAYARCEAKLLRQYSAVGARAYRPSRTRRDLSWLRRRLPDLLGTPNERGRWVCRASTVLGRLAGAVAQRRWVG